MRFSSLALLAVLALCLALGGGCKKSTPEDKTQAKAEAQPATPKPASAETVARVHWLGMKKILAETNAGFVKTLWERPQTARLQNQTLDKLALALVGGYPPANTNVSLSVTNYEALVATNPAASLARPLLNQLLAEECYVEIRDVANGSREVVLATRSDNASAALWQSNFPVVLQSSVPGTQRILGAKFLSLGNASLICVGGWALISVPGGENSLLRDFRNRIQSQVAASPFETGATNHWLEVDTHSEKLLNGFGIGLEGLFPVQSVSLWVIGDGESVRSRARLSFTRPLDLALDPWLFPTNLVHDPLVSFSALRGARPFISNTWAGLQLPGSAPNQLFLWALQGPAVETFCAASDTNASGFISAAMPLIKDKANPWLNAYRLGRMEASTNFNGMNWEGFPFMAPFIRSAPAGADDFIFCGLGPNVVTNLKAPDELILQFINRSNLVYYEWEMTGPRVQAWVYLSQLIRVVAEKPQLPFESASLEWLKSVAGTFGNCGTEVTQTGPLQFDFSRKSSCGLNSLELHLLADWLESPQFPLGLHTSCAPQTATRKGPRLPTSSPALQK